MDDDGGVPIYGTLHIPSQVHEIPLNPIKSPKNPKNPGNSHEILAYAIATASPPVLFKGAIDDHGPGARVLHAQGNHWNHRRSHGERCQRCGGRPRS